MELLKPKVAENLLNLLKNKGFLTDDSEILKSNPKFYLAIGIEECFKSEDEEGILPVIGRLRTSFPAFNESIRLLPGQNVPVSEIKNIVKKKIPEIFSEEPLLERGLRKGEETSFEKDQITF